MTGKPSVLTLFCVSILLSLETNARCASHEDETPKGLKTPYNATGGRVNELLKEITRILTENRTFIETTNSPTSVSPTSNPFTGKKITSIPMSTVTKQPNQPTNMESRVTTNQEFLELPTESTATPNQEFPESPSESTATTKQEFTELPAELLVSTSTESIITAYSDKEPPPKPKLSAQQNPDDQPSSCNTSPTSNAGILSFGILSFLGYFLLK